MLNFLAKALLVAAIAAVSALYSYATVLIVKRMYPTATKISECKAIGRPIIDELGYFKGCLLN